MSEIINANYFSPTENDNLLFDCNALMYIFILLVLILQMIYKSINEYLRKQFQIIRTFLCHQYFYLSFRIHTFKTNTIVT